MSNESMSEEALACAVQMLNHEGDLVWSRYNAFLTANGFLASMLASGFTQPQTTFGLPLQFTVLAIAGIVLCTLWRWITVRGFEQCRYYLVKAQEIESSLGQNRTFFKDSAGFGGEHQIQIDYCSKLAIWVFGALYVVLMLIQWGEFIYGILLTP